MIRTSWRFGFVVAIAALLALVSVAETQSKACKLATNIVMTGQWASMGIGIYNSFKLAIDQATARGDFKDMKVEIVYGDNAADTAQAVGLATRHGQDPEIVGALCCWISGIGIATHPTYNRYGLPVILAGSNDSRSSRPLHNSKVVFRNSPYDLINMKMAATYIKASKFNRIYLLSDTWPFGRTQVQYLQKFLTEMGHGAAILGYDTITPGEKDFSPILTKIKPLNVDLLYFAGMVVEYALIRQQMLKLGFTVPLMGSGGLFSETYLKIAGPAADGTLATYWGLPLEMYPEGRGLQFERDYKAAGFKDHYETFGPPAYIAGQVFAQAIKRAGCDRQKVLKELQTGEFDTILGPRFRFDENGMPEFKAIAVYRAEQGQWKMIDVTDPQATDRKSVV